MEDIVPSLLDKIATDFDLKVGADNEIEVLLGKITSGKGNICKAVGRFALNDFTGESNAGCIARWENVLQHC